MCPFTTTGSRKFMKKYMWEVFMAWPGSDTNHILSHCCGWNAVTEPQRTIKEAKMDSLTLCPGRKGDHWSLVTPIILYYNSRA